MENENTRSNEIQVTSLQTSLNQRPDVAYAQYYGDGGTFVVYIEPQEIKSLDELDASIIPAGVLAVFAEQDYVPLNIKYAEDGDFSEECIEIKFYRGENLFLQLAEISRNDDY